MVIIRFRLTDADEVRIDAATSRPLKEVLGQGASLAGIEIGSIIAVRNGEVITLETMVKNGDEIEVFPAISGG